MTGKCKVLLSAFRSVRASVLITHVDFIFWSKKESRSALYSTERQLETFPNDLFYSSTFGVPSLFLAIFIFSAKILAISLIPS